MSELGQRAVSGAVLAGALLAALWLGSWWYAVVLTVAAAIVLREYAGLIWRGWSGNVSRLLWLAFGIVYVGLGVRGLWVARHLEQGFAAALIVFLAVWATDVGAYAAGRLIGGPKIAPKISPSKTWAGYGGAVVLTTIVVFTSVAWLIGTNPWEWGLSICIVGVLSCAVIAGVAQAGDFFESWLKRRAGVKDSGALIPGHGGLFDRVDGLIPVAALFPVAAQFAVPS